jgi:hypothetical protein
MNPWQFLSKGSTMTTVIMGSVWLGLDQLAHQLTYILLVGGVFFAF